MSGQLLLDCFATKYCKKCDQTKPISEFHRNKRCRDGLTIYCRACNCARSRQWIVENPERKRAADAKWRAVPENRQRAAEKSARWRRENPDRYRETLSNWVQANRDRHYELSRRWRERNPEEARETRRRWDRANVDARRATAQLRRARQRGLTTVRFTAEQLAQKWAYYGNRCWICRNPADSTDHVKPIAKGGAHMLCNLRPICRACNSAKCAKWPYSPPRR